MPTQAVNRGQAGSNASSGENLEEGAEEQASTAPSRSEEPRPEESHIPPVAEEKCASPSAVLQTGG